MLQAPQFVYRLEDEATDATGGRMLTSYEVATRLSYLIWGSAPDVALLDAAEADAFANPGQLHDQVQRMLQDPRAREMSRHYVGQWLGVDNVPNIYRGPVEFPKFTHDLAEQLRQETLDVAEHVLWEDQGQLADLLTTDFTFATEDVAKHYGFPVQTEAWERYDLEGHPARLGVLTHASVLTVAAGGEQPSVVDRGLYILRNVLCSDVGAPPAGLDTSMTALGGATQRERAAARQAVAACGACHLQFDPLGLAFDPYDSVGQARTVDDNDNPLSGEGAFMLPSSRESVSFSSAAELIEHLADDPLVQQCVGLRKPLQFAIGRALTSDDACRLEEIEARALELGGTYPAVVTAIATHPSFRRIKAP